MKYTVKNNISYASLHIQYCTFAKVNLHTFFILLFSCPVSITCYNSQYFYRCYQFFSWCYLWCAFIIQYICSGTTILLYNRIVNKFMSSLLSTFLHCFLNCFSMFPRPLHHLSEQHNAATTAALLARLAGSGVRPPHPLWGKLPLLPHSLPQLLGLPPFPPHHHPAHHHHQQHHHQNQFSPPQQHHSFLQGGFHSSNSRGDGADSPIDGTCFLFYSCAFFYLSLYSI